MDKQRVIESVEEIIAKEVSAFNTTPQPRRIQIYKHFADNYGYGCIADFSRHENSPKGQVKATKYYVACGEQGRVINKSSILIQSHQELRMYLNHLHKDSYILSQLTHFAFLVGDPLPAYNVSSTAFYEKTHLQWCFETGSTIDDICSAVWVLVAKGE